MKNVESKEFIELYEYYSAPRLGFRRSVLCLILPRFIYEGSRMRTHAHWLIPMIGGVSNNVTSPCLSRRRNGNLKALQVLTSDVIKLVNTEPMRISPIHLAMFLVLNKQLRDTNSPRVGTDDSSELVIHASTTDQLESKHNKRISVLKLVH